MRRCILILALVGSLALAGTAAAWEGVTSFNSELFRRTVSDVAGIPSTEILQQRDDLRSPAKPLEASPAIGGDRDYNVSLTLNRLDRDRVAFFDVTELTPQDLQRCRDAIPASIRRPTVSCIRTLADATRCTASAGVAPSRCHRAIRSVVMYRSALSASNTTTVFPSISRRRPTAIAA